MICDACKHCVPCFTWYQVVCLKRGVLIDMRSVLSSCEDFEKDDGFKKHERKCKCKSCTSIGGVNEE